MEVKRVNCRQCVYYYVTWEKNFPNGCKAFGFKTRELPSVTVFKSSGNQCMNFIKK